MDHPQNENGPVAAGPVSEQSASHQRFTPANSNSLAFTTQGPTPYLTAAEFLRWRNEHSADLAAAEARAAAQAVDVALRDVASVMQWGCGLQHACDRAWHRRSGRNFPDGLRRAVREALVAIGWTPPAGKRGGTRG